LLRGFRTLPDLEKFKARVECDPPSVDLYTYNGKVEIQCGDKNGNAEALDADNLLLRGSKIKNTEFIYGKYIRELLVFFFIHFLRRFFKGAAVYTGQDTKLALNSKIGKKKFSVVER